MHRHYLVLGDNLSYPTYTRFRGLNNWSFKIMELHGPNFMVLLVCFKIGDIVLSSRQTNNFLLASTLFI